MNLNTLKKVPRAISEWKSEWKAAADWSRGRAEEEEEKLVSSSIPCSPQQTTRNYLPNQDHPANNLLKDNCEVQLPSRRTKLSLINVTVNYSQVLLDAV